MISKQLGIKLSALTLALMLAGCGGGGSDGYYNNDGGSNPSTENPKNPSTGEEVQSLNASAVVLTDANGMPIQVINSEGAKATVRVTDQAGRGISGAIVTFTATGEIELGSANGAVLTDAEGEASISLVPKNPSLTGVYKISANVEYQDESTTVKDLTFSLQPLNIVLSDIIATTSNLEVGGTTNITLKTNNERGIPQNNVLVNFSASCGTFEPTAVTSINSGNVTTTYKAISANGDLCQDEPVIQAASQNSKTPAQIKVKIDEIKADSLVYTTTSAVDLGISGSGSAASGQIEFTLFANGRPAKNQDVELELTLTPPDFSFVSLGNAKPKIVQSDSNGKIVVNLYPGTKPGPVEVKASLVSNPQISALSKNVKVSTGRVTQNGVSLSVSKQSLRTDIDGDTSTIVARLTDRVGNAVPAGTVISFIAEGGKVDSSCATNAAGSCSVTLTTQNPRPIDNRVTVLAFVEGDKDYIDKDGSNSFTTGDVLTHNIGAFYRDDNEDGLHNVGEFVYNKAKDVLGCAASSFLQPNLNQLDTPNNKLNTCDNGLSAVLRQQLIFAFAHDTPTFVWKNGFTSNQKIAQGTGNFSFQVYGNSLKTVPMPSGTLVNAAVKDNTTFEPVVKLIQDSTDSTKKILEVSGAEPDSVLNVTLASKEYVVNIEGNGKGRVTGLDASVIGDPTFTYKNQTCEAEVFGGDVTVPNTMPLLTPTNFSQGNSPVVNYTIRLKGCVQGDDVKVSTAVPGGKVTTVWLELR
ncbi:MULTISPECIES: Ig-like domain-containing protein [Acinetobacter]|uniref:Ig-like domain-containing protein n=1 Tax=Acinetobacter TaxID=469 RepID=UPI0015D15091|nr:MULTISPECIES: hypothetical protein [Acinetobacter]MCP0911029.1 hypothetical protein [Acinetobacter pseudolwoffii]